MRTILAYSNLLRYFLLTNTHIKVECFGIMQWRIFLNIAFTVFIFLFIENSTSLPVTKFYNKQIGLGRSHFANCVWGGTSVSISLCFTCTYFIRIPYLNLTYTFLTYTYYLYLFTYTLLIPYLYLKSYLRIMITVDFDYSSPFFLVKKYGFLRTVFWTFFIILKAFLHD